MDNVYNTTDPQKLLRLKRQEADALLDILRTIQLDNKSIRQLSLITKNLLRAQLGVKKMIFFYEYKQVWNEGARLGFESFSEAAVEEMMRMKTITAVQTDVHPELSKYEVEYIVPLVNKDRASAFFAIAAFADSEVEAQSDLIFIETLGSILAVAIRNRELFEEKMEQEFIKKELEVAETIQKQLLISDFSRFNEIDVFGLNLAHHRVGGDFFDVIKKGRGTTFICIADVSGKGMGAALLMSNLQANLRALCAQYGDLKKIIQELNKILFGITTGEKFVTLFLAKIDTKNRRLQYINAGHNYPIFLQQGQPGRLDKGCMLLGIMPELSIEKSAVYFEKGDVLFMFTDGVVEQHNPEGEMFGSERIIQQLSSMDSQMKSEEIVKQFQHILFEYARQENTVDDVTMLSVKFL